MVGGKILQGQDILSQTKIDTLNKSQGKLTTTGNQFLYHSLCRDTRQLSYIYNS